MRRRTRTWATTLSSQEGTGWQPIRVAAPGLSRKTHQEEEEDLDNCDTREEGMNVNDDVCPGMEEWFVKNTLF